MPNITKPRVRTIGGASETTGVKVETIRYYERIGLLSGPDRTAGGNRLYDSAALARLTFVRRCRTLGFSIDEIRELLQMVDRRDFTCAEVHRLTVEHLKTVQEKVDALSRMATALEDMASECSQGSVPDCPIIDALLGTP